MFPWYLLLAPQSAFTFRQGRTVLGVVRKRCCRWCVVVVTQEYGFQCVPHVDATQIAGDYSQHTKLRVQFARQDISAESMRRFAWQVHFSKQRNRWRLFPAYWGAREIRASGILGWRHEDICVASRGYMSCRRLFPGYGLNSVAHEGTCWYKKAKERWIEKKKTERDTTSVIRDSFVPLTKIWFSLLRSFCPPTPLRASN